MQISPDCSRSYATDGVRLSGRRPGELETWNAGIRAARRGAGRRGPAGAPEWPRGAHSGGGHGLPHGPAARVPRGGREVSSVGRARVLAKAPTVDARAGLRSVPRRYLDVPTVR